MPKKQQHNSFYYFMLDFKEEQRKKGINYGNMQEVATAAGTHWKDAPLAVRKKYEETAKGARQKNHMTAQKYTSTGIPLSVIEQQEKDRRDAEMFEREDIRSIVKLKSFNGGIVHEDIYVIDVTSYCKVGNEHLFGEVTILRFNLHDGIRDHYHELINPGVIPLGYALDVKLAVQDLGILPPDDTEGQRSNYIQILANIMDYLRQGKGKMLPPLFTLPDKVLQVTDFIQQLCSRSGEDDTLFRIYRLHIMFYTLINSIKVEDNEGLPRESLALDILNKDIFTFTPNLACELHEESDKPTKCTTSRCKRWAFSIIDMCLPLVGIEAIAGRHLPADFDVEATLACKEEKQAYMEERLTEAAKRSGGTPLVGLPNAWGLPPSSSTLDDSRESYFSVASGSRINTSLDAPAPEKREKRTNPPLRMPKESFAGRKPPELTTSDFPKLVAGHGRGRGLSASLDKMKM